MVVSVVMMKSVRLVHGGGGGRPDGHRVRGGGLCQGELADDKPLWVIMDGKEQLTFNV